MTYPSRSLFVLVFLLLAALPLGASAQTLPAPVLRMSETMGSLPANRADSSFLFTVFESGTEMLAGSLKGSVTAGAGKDADAGGTLSVTIEDKQKNLFEQLLGTNKVSLGVEFRLFPSREALYFRITKFPSIASLGKIPKKWVVIDDAEIFEQYRASSATDLSVKEALAAFATAHAKYPAFTFTERGSTATEYSYDYRANPRMFFKFMNEANRIAGSDVIFSAEEIDQIATRFSSITGTLRIAKATYLPLAMSYDVRYASAPYSATVIGSTNYTYGVTAKIKKPSGAVSPEKFFDDVSGSTSDARSKGNDAVVRSNLSSSRVQAELYYDTNGSYKGVCKTSAFKAYRNAGSTVTCNDAQDAYAISGQLSNKKYYCADSAGTGKETSKKLGSKTTCS